MKQIKSVQPGTFFLAAAKQLLDQYPKLVEKKEEKTRKKKQNAPSTNKSLLETVENRGLPGACSQARVLLNVSMPLTQRLDVNEFEQKTL